MEASAYFMSKLSVFFTTHVVLLKTQNEHRILVKAVTLNSTLMNMGVIQASERLIFA